MQIQHLQSKVFLLRFRHLVYVVDVPRARHNRQGDMAVIISLVGVSEVIKKLIYTEIWWAKRFSLCWFIYDVIVWIGTVGTVSVGCWRTVLSIIYIYIKMIIFIRGYIMVLSFTFSTHSYTKTTHQPERKIVHGHVRLARFLHNKIFKVMSMVSELDDFALVKCSNNMQQAYLSK